MTPRITYTNPSLLFEAERLDGEESPIFVFLSAMLLHEAELGPGAYVHQLLLADARDVGEPAAGVPNGRAQADDSVIGENGRGGPSGNEASSSGGEDNDELHLD